MKPIRTLLVAGGIAAALGCGYAVNNYVPEDDADAVQTADGSFMPDDAGNDGTGNPEDVLSSDGGLDVGYDIPENDAGYDAPEAEADVPGPSIQGSGVYCVRSVTPGASHIGVLVNYTISDPDLVNEMGLVATSERGARERFDVEYPNTPSAAYFNAKRNFGSVGDIADVDVYAIDGNGDERVQDLNKIDCEELDKLLNVY